MSTFYPSFSLSFHPNASSRFGVPLKRLVRPLLFAGMLLGSLSANALQAGIRQMTVPGADPIPVALFYPTSAPAQTMKLGGIWQLNVAMGGPIAPDLKGLIVLSHGTGGAELGHHQLATRLAQEGYLVAALRHPHDDWQDRSLVTSGRYFTERPAQVSRVLDAVLADPVWAAKLPAGRIGALGHSAGGFTVLALAGAQSRPAVTVEHCRAVRDDVGFCGLAQGNPGQANGSLVAAGEAAAITPSARDDRIRAVVAMSPMAVVLTPESLAQVKVPVRIYVAQQDQVLNHNYHGRFAAKHIPGAELVNAAGAGHFAFMSKPMMNVATDAGDPSADPAGFDRAAYLGKLEQELVDYFNAQLK
jgi:predicted dienelactone hydrolase